MMAKVLTTADSFECQYQGKVQASGAGKLVVAGNEVLTVVGVSNASVSGCSPPGSPPPPPCVTVASVSGQAAKLFVSGSPVLLDQFSAVGSTGHNIALKSSAQSKLEAS